MNADGQNLSYAALVQNIFVPGIGNVDKTLEINQSQSKVIKMTLADGFVEILFRGQQGKQVTALAPITSFTHVVLAKK